MHSPRQGVSRHARGKNQRYFWEKYVERQREPPYVNVEEWSDRFDHLRQDPAELLRRKGLLENLDIQFWNKNDENDSGAEEMATELRSRASECGWGRSSLVTCHLGSGNWNNFRNLTQFY